VVAQRVLGSASDAPEAVQGIAQPEKPRLPRPWIVTILALQNYVGALGCLIAAIYELIKFRVDLLLLCLFASLVTYAIASGLWRLKDWARWATIVLSLLNLFTGEPWVLFPLYALVGGGPMVIICGRVVTILLIVYLLSRRIDNAFGVSPLNLKWRLAVGILALVCFVIPLTKAEPELNAIKWHLRHGDRVTVNGVSFPIYQWQMPGELSDESRLEIRDIPGPLRPQDRFSALTIAGRLEDENGQPEDFRTLSPPELVDRKYKSYQKAGYTDLQKFQTTVRGQTLECIKETRYGDAIYCYGEGPIYSIFFVGSDNSLERFNHMIAEAR
jgi:hypothetical protein